MILTPTQIVSKGNLEHYRTSRRVPFPHMGPADARVWRFALAAGILPEVSWTYDERLGGAAADLVEPDHEHKPMWETLLKKRVDVVGIVLTRPWLIEVKPIGSFAALGQCLGYLDLWERERGADPKPLSVCVCAFVDLDLAPTFERFGVRVISLPTSYATQCV